MADVVARFSPDDFCLHPNKVIQCVMIFIDRLIQRINPDPDRLALAYAVMNGNCKSTIVPFRRMFYKCSFGIVFVFHTLSIYPSAFHVNKQSENW